MALNLAQLNRKMIQIGVEAMLQVTVLARSMMGLLSCKAKSILNKHVYQSKMHMNLHLHGVTLQ